jgi:hypothetical protein
MLSRRAFVGAGAAFAVLATSPARAIGHSKQRAPGASPFRVIFDRTFREGLAFGVTAERRGAHVDGVGADLGAFWMSTLEPLLRRGPLTLAGLTASAPLFCLELLCRDYGLRTVYRIEHALGPDGRVRHALTGDPSLAAWPERLAAAGAEWPAAAAAVATAGATLPRPATAIELLNLAGGRAARSLFTWVIKSRG